MTETQQKLEESRKAAADRWKEHEEATAILHFLWELW